MQNMQSLQSVSSAERYRLIVVTDPFDPKDTHLTVRRGAHLVHGRTYVNLRELVAVFEVAAERVVGGKVIDNVVAAYVAEHPRLPQGMFQPHRPLLVSLPAEGESNLRLWRLES